LRTRDLFLWRRRSAIKARLGKMVPPNLITGLRRSDQSRQINLAAIAANIS